MTEKTFIQQAIFTAIEFEYKIFEFYRQSASIIHNNRELKNTLLKFAEDEKLHILELRKILGLFENNFDLQNTDNIIDSLSDKIVKPENINFSACSNFYEIIQFAMREENKIIDYYKSLNKQPYFSAPAKKIIEGLIDSEIKHKSEIAAFTIDLKNKIQKTSELKNILLFDLDGTIINGVIDKKNSEGFLRPNARGILKQLAEKYLLCIFSKSDIEYIDYTMNFCGLNDLFVFYFDYTFTVSSGMKDLNHIIKRLALPEFMINKMILVDDSYNVKPQENHIKAHTFDGSIKDNFFNSRLIDLITAKFEILNQKLKY